MKDSNTNKHEFALRTREAYDAVAHKFAETRSGKGSWQEFPFLVPYIKKEGVLLDVGCGSGRLAQYLEAEKVPILKYYGLDFSEGLIMEATQRTKGHAFPVEFKQGNMQEAGQLYPQDSMDTIISIAAFHHLTTNQERQNTLYDCLKLLKIGGILILTNWNIAKEERKKGVTKISEQEYLVPFTQDVSTYQRYYYQFTKEELEELLDNAGFIDPIFFSVHEAQCSDDPYLGPNIVTVARKP